MKKTILTIAIIAIIMAAPLWAQSESDFEVRQNPDNTITITRYNGSVRDVVIPQTLYGLRVTAIGDMAFDRKGLTSVVIPNTVITIENGSSGYGAFSGNNNLTRVTLGNSIRTIGDYAFSRTGLTEIIIPNSVTSIGRSVFSNSFSYSDGFVGNLRRVTFGSGIRTIGQDAFASQQITELNLPASLQTIGSGAFYHNQIRSLTIPNTVTSVGDGAFQENPIETVVIPASLARGGLSNEAFSSYSENLVNITLPANMDAGVVRGNFGEAFANFYVNQNRAAGTYIKRGPIWTKPTAAELRQEEEARQAAIRQQEADRQAAIRQAEQRRQTGEYIVGDEGPGGGIIFYVNRAGFTVDGYGTAHYLETAPVNMGNFAWASGNNQRTNIRGTNRTLGSGRRNTDLILAADANAPAAKACKDYRGGGLNDWFLPSEEELNLMYVNLHRNGIGNFGSNYFWSSSQTANNGALCQNFNDGNRGGNLKRDGSFVRAVRAF